MLLSVKIMVCNISVCARGPMHQHKA